MGGVSGQTLSLNWACFGVYSVANVMLTTDYFEYSNEALMGATMYSTGDYFVVSANDSCSYMYMYVCMYRCVCVCIGYTCICYGPIHNPAHIKACHPALKWASLMK